MFTTGRLLLGINPSRVFWYTVNFLSLRCGEFVDLHGFAVRLASGGGIKSDNVR